MHIRDMSLILETHPVILAELETLLFTLQAINSQPWRLINNCKRLHEKSCSNEMLNGSWPRDS